MAVSTNLLCPFWQDTYCIMAENFIFAHKCTFVDQSKRKQRKSWHSTNLSTNHKTALQTLLHSWTLDWLKILLHWLSGKLAYLRKYVCVNRRSSCPKKIHITGIDLKRSVFWKVCYFSSFEHQKYDLLYITLVFWNWDHHFLFYILFQKNATPSLRDINMHVKEGQLVAVVGSVGSGMEFFISGWKIIFLNSTTK